MNICCLEHLLMYLKAYYHWALMIRQMTSAREWKTAVERRLYCWPDVLTLKKTLSSWCCWLCCMLWFVCVVTHSSQTTAMICAKSFLMPSSVQTSTELPRILIQRLLQERPSPSKGRLWAAPPDPRGSRSRWGSYISGMTEYPAHVATHLLIPLMHWS